MSDNWDQNPSETRRCQKCGLKTFTDACEYCHWSDSHGYIDKNGHPVDINYTHNMRLCHKHRCYVCAERETREMVAMHDKHSELWRELRSQIGPGKLTYQEASRQYAQATASDEAARFKYDWGE